MVFLAVLMTVAVMIAVDVLFMRRQKVADGPAQTLVPTPRAPTEPADLLYNHSHAWARVESSAVTVGLDDFVQRLTGPIDRIETRRPGDLVAKGEPLWTVRFGDRTISQRAPISGRVMQINQAVIDNPALANQAPYGDGWIVKLVPRSLAEEANTLLDHRGFRAWNDVVRTRLLQDLRPELGLLYGDAAQVRQGAGREMDQERWERLSARLFNDKE
jgi:glycine cleavage system H protein